MTTNRNNQPRQTSAAPTEHNGTTTEAAAPPIQPEQQIIDISQTIWSGFIQEKVPWEIFAKGTAWKAKESKIKQDKSNQQSNNISTFTYTMAQIASTQPQPLTGTIVKTNEGSKEGSFDLSFVLTIDEQKMWFWRIEATPQGSR